MTDMTTVKNCFKDPKASECTGKHNYYNYLNYNQEHYSNYLGTYGGTTTLPTVLAGKCDGATCTTLNTDMTAVKSCFANPTDSSCTGTYQRQEGKGSVFENGRFGSRFHFSLAVLDFETLTKRFC